jgi:hypothetical protein
VVRHQQVSLAARMAMPRAPSHQTVGTDVELERPTDQQGEAGMVRESI